VRNFDLEKLFLTIEGDMNTKDESKNWISRYLKEIVLVAAGAGISALFGYFKDDIRASVDHFFTSGSIGGSYIMRAYTFEGKPKPEWISFDSDVVLKHFGTRVIGERMSSKAYVWELSGYFRDPILSLSYENVDKSAVGTGTFTLQREGPFALWGHWIGVECNPLTHQKFLAQCPVLVYRADQAQLVEVPKYKEFMARECIKISLDYGPCPVKSPDLTSARE
jgi:hypothetical protein